MIATGTVAIQAQPASGLRHVPGIGAGPLLKIRISSKDVEREMCKAWDDAMAYGTMIFEPKCFDGLAVRYSRV